MNAGRDGRSSRGCVTCQRLVPSLSFPTGVPGRHSCRRFRLAFRCVFVGALACLPAALPACSTQRAADSADADLAASSLDGSWLLVEFQPEIELEPMFAALLRDELGVAVVELHGGQLSAKGRTVELERRYVVLDQIDDDLRVAVFDEPGVSTRFLVRRVKDELVFRCQDAPWRGSGTLRRIGAATDGDQSGQAGAGGEQSNGSARGTRFNAIPSN